MTDAAGGARGDALRVLVADDSRDVREMVELGLRRAGFDVVTAEDGEAAVATAQITPPFDVIVLDVEMPGIGGFDVLQTLRESGVTTPVIFLSGREGEGDRILGLDLGADDYVPKSSSIRELAARIRARARAASAAASAAAAAAAGPTPAAAPGVVINRAAREVRVEGTEVVLSPKEYDLLVWLVDRPHRVVSRDELLEAVWGSADAWQSRKTLTEHVRRVRSKLDDTGGSWGSIQNTRAVGYRYDPPVAAD